MARETKNHGSEKPFSRLSVVSRSKQVQDQLSAAIMRGDFLPGERIPSERELTDSFGVSRVSIREAIKSLEALGLVEVRHGNGCFVTNAATRKATNLGRWLDVYRDDLVDLIGVRGVLDTFAAELAADRGDQQGIARVEEARDAFARAVEDGGTPVDRLIALDEGFHTSIGTASDNPLLAGLLEALHGHLAQSRRLWLADRSWLSTSVKEHAAITEAIVNGDRLAAGAAVVTHMAAVRRMLDSAQTAAR